MPQFGTRQLDIRDQNAAVEKVLAATENPRHRYLLDPADVLTVAQAAELLAPLIKPLPPFDDSLLPAGQRPGAGA